MPMHDWTRVRAGVHHNFHVLWMSAITHRLNAGLLPAGFFAMAEQIIGGPETDVVTLQTGTRPRPPAGANSGTSAAVARPQTRFVLPLDADRYARKAHRVAVRHELGEVVAVIELVSPGYKDRLHALRSFVDKAVDLLFQGVNLLIVDPFPPGPFDPQGLPQAIGTSFTGPPFELPPDKPLTLTAFQASPTVTAYVEVIAVGDRLPNMPLFLYEDHYVNVPLEETYEATWHLLPPQIRGLLEPTS